MAVPPQTNEAFLREVDEELRRDALFSFWQRHGRMVAIVVAAGLAVLAGVLGWRHYRETSAASQSAQFDQVYDLLAAQKFDEAAKPLASLAASDVPVYRALARSVEADVALRKLNPSDQAKSAAGLQEASAKFAAIVADSSVPQPMRDLALIRQTYADYDRLTPQQVIDRLKPLAVAGNPWLGSAGELVAIAQLRLNQPAKARATLQLIIADQQVPDTLRQRAVQLSSAIENGATGGLSPATTGDSTKK